MADLRNRGVRDILIACVDGLAGFAGAVTAAFPQTVVQRCVVHLIRNSLRPVARRDAAAVADELRKVYTAPTAEAAFDALAAFTESTWGRSSGELEAERPGRVGEPAVVRGAEVQGPGALGDEVEDIAVASLGLGRSGIGGGELAVDVGEELGEFACAGAGGHDALLVVAELGPDQVEVALGLVLVDLGEQFGLGAAGAAAGRRGR
jgi:hypothetical protein